MKILFASGMVFFLFLLCLCQFYFYFKNEIKFNDMKGVFVFMDRIFFFSSPLTNFSSSFFLMSCIMGIALAWVMNEPVENIISYYIGLLGMIFLFLHCRFFYVKKSHGNEFDFLREFFLRKEISLTTFFIWMSRLCYLLCFFRLFYYGN